MKKIKVLFLSLALCLSCAAVFTLTGCKPSEEDSTNSSSEWFETEEGTTVSLRFSESSVEVQQYESLTLKYTLKGSGNAVQFTSSNEEIVTVDANGVVRAKGALGNATITATVDGVSATCEVKVIESPYAPVLLVENTIYTIEQGETLQFDVKAEWNNEILIEPITYGVALAENSQNVSATLSVDENVVSVSAEKDVEIVVYTTVRGIYTSKVITVNVVEPSYKLQPTTAAYIPQEGKYVAKISTTAEIGDMVNSIPLDFVLVKGSQTIEDVDVAWTVEGNAAVLQDNAIIGQSRGEVVLTGKTSYDGTDVSITVVCHVIAPEVHLEETHVIEVEKLQAMSIETPIVGTLQNAEMDGEQISSLALGNKIAFNKAKLPKTAKELGKRRIVINTSLVSYTMDVEMYTMVIDTAEELDEMRTIANTGATEWSTKFNKEVNSEYYDGYFVLGCDIAYNKTITSMTDSQKVYNVQGAESDFSRGFKGIFDGRGYNIDGMTVGKSTNNACSGGMFGYLANGGVVKNVSFTNATLLANHGFICARGDGLIENVSISYAKIGGDRATTVTNAWGYRAMGSFFSFEAGSNATVRNCLVDASTADVTYVSKGGDSDVLLVGRVNKVENVIAICPNGELLECSSASVKAKTYTSSVLSADLFEEFDSSIWTVKDGVLTFINQADKIDVNRGISFVDMADTLIVGFDMTVKTDNPYVQFSIEEIAGATLHDGVLSVTEECYGKTVTITATSLFNSAITATHSVYIESFGTKIDAPETDEMPIVYSTKPMLSIGSGEWMGETNRVYLGQKLVGEGTLSDGITLDCNAIGWGVKTVTVVSESDGARKYFTIDIKIDYQKGDFAESALVEESAFSSWRGTPSTYTLIDKATDETPPEGYEKIKRVDCNQVFSSAMSAELFNKTNLSEYSDIWMAMKLENAEFISQTTGMKTSAWIEFHFTQTSNNIWAVDVFVDGALYKTILDFDASGTNANSIYRLLFRGGWVDGFLIYNSRDTSLEINEENPTSIYVTEIRGIKKA